MKLRIIEFYSDGQFEVKPGDVVEFDEQRTALLLGGGHAIEERVATTPEKAVGEKATRPRKRKEV